jgi:hypothetical protein
VVAVNLVEKVANVLVVLAKLDVPANLSLNLEVVDLKDDVDLNTKYLIVN